MQRESDDPPRWFVALTIVERMLPAAITELLGVTPSKTPEGMEGYDEEGLLGLEPPNTWTLESRVVGVPEGNRSLKADPYLLERSIWDIIERLEPAWPRLVELVQKGADVAVEGLLPLETHFAAVSLDEGYNPGVDPPPDRIGIAIDLKWDLLAKLGEIHADLFIEYVPIDEGRIGAGSTELHDGSGC